jgi:DNA-binding NtrC family response regulator
MLSDMTPTILVVEDEPAIQELVAINLKHAGFLVVRAGSAEDAESSSAPRCPTCDSRLDAARQVWRRAG